MIKTIFNVVSGAAAKIASGRLTQFDADGLLFDLKLTTVTGHTMADFDSWKVNATLKGEGGKDVNVFQDVRLGDLLKHSDFAGGFSMEAAGNAASRYTAYVPLGNYMINGDDALDISISVPLHANAVVDCNVSACDFVKLNEKIVGYETVVGNGAEILIRDAFAIYLCSAETGATISVRDQEREYFVTDREVIASGNAMGRMEKFEDFGLLYSDGSGYGQNVRVKLASNSYALVTRGYYPLERVGKRAASAETAIKALQDKIKLENPDKFQYLVAAGLIG